ncbi:MAG: hypothetical protein IPN17_32800 [Deltaproteobacteria bacterium]|nr:hypothetical protein [Deltaproteobacteria bacterium]
MLRWQVSQWTPSLSPSTGSRAAPKLVARPPVKPVGVWQRKQTAPTPGICWLATVSVARKSGSRAALAIIEGPQVSPAM